MCVGQWEDGQPIDQWHISGARGYELDDTPTYIEQLNISLAANPDIVWDNYKFRLVGGVDPIRFPVWITFTETQMEYLIPGREDAAACLTDSSEIAEDRLDGEEEFHAYSYAAVVAAVADSSYIETDDAQGGTNIVLDVANQPVKHQNKMLGNYFIIDPKGSVYQDCAYLLKKYGYNVRVLNFYNVELSYHYNPYAYINSELDVLNLGADFMNATKEDGEKNDYWTGAAEDFFTSLILYIYKSKDETNKSFERVVQILTSIDYQDRKLSPVCEYSLLMEKYAIDRENEGLDEDKVVLNYKGMKGLPQETLGGVVANLQKRLGLWYTEVVSKFTAEDEMEFDNFTKPNSKEAIFVIYPIGSTTFKPIISMFYQQFISRMKYMASQKCGGSLPVMLNIEADEICNISKIPTLKDDIATIRSMNIRMTFVIQSLTQLQAKYDKEAEDILSNCGIVCFFGSRDNKIRKWLCEEQIGYTTFKKENKSYSKNGTSESEQDQKKIAYFS